MAITLDTPLDQFPGVGEARAKKLEKLGLTRCAQLLTYFPRDYEDRREIYSIRSAPLGRKVCVRAMAAEHPRLARIRRGLELVQLRVVDQAGALHLTFFNQSYVERALLPGEDYVFYGQVERQGNRLSMTLTLVGDGEDLFLSAITSGGSQGMFFKFNTWGEEFFLDTLRELAEGRI